MKIFVKTRRLNQAKHGYDRFGLMLVFKVEKHFETNPHSIYSASHKTVYPGEGLTEQEFVEYSENNSPVHTLLNNAGSDAEEEDYSRQFPRKCLYMLMRKKRKHRCCSV